MNRSRKIVVVAALGVLALMVTTGWNVLAGAAWPPEPYQEYSFAGTWLEEGGSNLVVTVSPPDPKTGVGSFLGNWVTPDLDPTGGGQYPEATSWSPWFGTYIMTGPDTAQTKGVLYVTKPGTILDILVVEHTFTLTAPDRAESYVVLSRFSAAADKDGDRRPDEGEQPLWSQTFTGRIKRL